MKSFIAITSFVALAFVSIPAAQAQSTLYGNNYGTNNYGASNYGSLRTPSYGSGLVNSESHTTRGHTRRDGTYVQPYRATNPNNNRSDNYSTQGNINPYTGRAGTVNPYRP